MWQAAWKSVKGHRGRLALSMIAVSLGTAFMVGALTFTGMLAQIFENIGKGAISDVSVDLVGVYEREASESNTASYDKTRLVEADLQKFRNVPGVQSAEGMIVSFDLYPLNKDGRVISLGGAPAMTFSWIEGPAYGRQPSVVLSEGRKPERPEEAVLDPTTLNGTGHKVGDEVSFVLSDGTQLKKKVVGTATWGKGGSAGVQYIFLSPAESQRLFMQGADAYMTGWIAIDEGANRQEVARAVNQVVPAGYEAYDGDRVFKEVSTALDEGLTFINTFLLIFAAVGLIVAIFLIVNTFSILVAQRGRELALYRALGASRGQVQLIVLLEATITGLLGSVFGVVLGVLLAGAIAWVMTRLGMDMTGTAPVPTLQAVLAAILVGTIVTLLSAWWPAVRAGRTPPVQAMTGVTEKAETKAGVGEWIAIAMAGVGAIAILAGAGELVPKSLHVMGAGAVMMLVGVAGVAPVIGRPLTWTLGRGYRMLFRTPGKLADLNVSRQPRRTAATAAALMIGLTLVTLLSVLGRSASASVTNTIRASLPADFQISSVNLSPLPNNIVDKVAAVDGVEHIYPVYSTAARPASGGLLGVSGYDPQAFGVTYALSLTEGQLFGDRLGDVVVQESTASARGWKVGDTIKLATPLPQLAELRIVGIATTPKGANAASLSVNVATAKALGSGEQPQRLSILTKPDRDLSKVRADLQAAIAQLPMVQVADREEYAEAQAATIDSLLNTIYALLGLAIVIAILGIINTLVLSIIERTREIGLLRAVGLQRQQLRLMISLESVAMAVLGAVLGMLLGLLFGVLLRARLESDGLTTLAVPWRELIVFLIGSVIVGVLAAVWPGRRAAKMNILDAIATD